MSEGLPSVSRTTPSAVGPLGVDGLAKEALDLGQRRQIIAVVVRVRHLSVVADRVLGEFEAVALEDDVGFRRHRY